jgi:hypothetical protein
VKTRTIAALELTLLFPAALFMISLLVRELAPLAFQPAHAAEQVVLWYAGRLWTLWVLLLALPFAVLVTGCATLWQERMSGTTLLRAVRQSLSTSRSNLATCIVAAATLAAGVILAIVVLHMAAN